MGIFSWLNHSTEKRATQLIEAGLTQMKVAGLFDFDPIQSARQVKQYATSRLPDFRKTSIQPEVLASSWLVVFVLSSKQTRGERLPFANVALALLQVVAGGHGLRLSTLDRNIAERALGELSNKFFNENSVNVDFAQASSTRDAIPMGGATSIDCIMAEHGYLHNLYGSNGDWATAAQSVVHEDGRTFDRMNIIFKNGTEKTVWFDITESWKIWAADAHTLPASSRPSVAQPYPNPLNGGEDHD